MSHDSDTRDETRLHTDETRLHADETWLHADERQLPANETQLHAVRRGINNYTLGFKTMLVSNTCIRIYLIYFDQLLFSVRLLNLNKSLRPKHLL